MVEKSNKIVQTVIEQLELPETFENGELVTEVAKNYGVGIERLFP
jgi:hypothetical protein